MAKLKPEFFAGCRASGTSEQVIEQLWATNERSADYSFNSSHAACYALISYRTAWLKANYPAEYMAALISSVMDTKDKVPFFVAQAEQMGISILPPDVNLSDHEFVVVEGNIRFGLDAVKGVGYAAVEAIKRAREEGGPFRDLWDFCARVDSRAVNKKAIEALIKCGAFGSTGASRKGMLDVLEHAQNAGQKAQQDALIGQGSIFDLGGPEQGAAAGGGAAACPVRGAESRADPGRRVRARRAAGGREGGDRAVHLRPPAQGSARRRCGPRSTVVLGELAERRDGDWVTVGGMITQCKRIRTKKGDPMMFATLDDLECAVEILVFGKALAECEDALQPDSIVVVRGRVDHKDREKTCIVAQQIDRFEASTEDLQAALEHEAKLLRPPQPLRLQLDATVLAATVAGRAEGVAVRLPGRVRRGGRAADVGRRRGVRLGRGFRVARSASLHAELDALLGPAMVAEVGRARGERDVGGG